MKSNILSILNAEQNTLTELFQLAEGVLMHESNRHLRKFDTVENTERHIFVPIFKGMGYAKDADPTEQPPFTARFVIYQHIFPEKKQYLKIRYDYRDTEGDVEFFDETKQLRYQQIKGNYNKTEYAIKCTLEKAIGILEESDPTDQLSRFISSFGIKTYTNEAEIKAKTAEYLADLGYETLKAGHHTVWKESSRGPGSTDYRLGIMSPIHDRGSDSWGDVASSTGGVITMVEGFNWDK